jgi:hypothetical protein
MNEILEKSLLNKVERLEAFEDRMNIRFENFSARVSSNNMVLYCEVYPTIGTELTENITIECVIYDLEGAILKKETSYIYESDFFGFEVLEFNFSDSVDKAGKIRIYPKKG